MRRCAFLVQMRNALLFPSLFFFFSLNVVGFHCLFFFFIFFELGTFFERMLSCVMSWNCNELSH